MKYRPEIDVLRATSILAVVAFHYFPPIFPNGYLGVDLFFVISGFLISRIILNDLESETFSFINFWERRSNRILPALLVLLVITMLLGLLIMFPSETELLAKHQLASILFLQNFNVISDLGYFDLLAQFKPLLHLWSLSIEEQFYLVWPIILVIFFTRPTIRLCVILSLFLGSVWWFTTIDFTENPSSYFLPWIRMWELITGGLVVLALRPWLQNQPQKSDCIVIGRNQHNFISNWIFDVIFLFSCFAIVDVLAINSYETWFEETFESRNAKAFLVTALAVLFLVSGSFSCIAKKMNRLSTLTGLGKISYPVYLFHWPLLCFATLISIEVGLLEKLFLIIATIILSVLTYYFIEQPIRLSKKPRVVCLRILSTAAVLLAFSFIVFMTQGLPSRFKGINVNDILTAQNDWQGYGPAEGRFDFVSADGSFGALSNSPNSGEVIFIGDSYAVQYFPLVRSLTLEGKSKNIHFLTNQGCFPIQNFSSPTGDCEGFFDDLTLQLNSAPKTVRQIVFAFSWTKLCLNSNPKFGVKVDGVIKNIALGEYAKSCIEVATDIVERFGQGFEVFVIGDYPGGQGFDPAGKLSNKVTGRRNFPVWNIQNTTNQKFIVDEVFLHHYSQLIDGFIAVDATPIEVLDYICPNLVCDAFDDNGEYKFSDPSHLRPQFTKNFSNIIQLLRK